MLAYLESSPQSSSQPRVVRDDSGQLRYEGTSIPAVGARDVTLAEAADPRVVARSDGEPEAVLLSLTEIESDQKLLWALPAGTRLDGDEEPLYKIPWEVWQEHASEPVGAWLPECDATGLDRALAIREREYRFAKQALDDMGVARQYLVLLASRLGRSRRVVGEALDLSPARVQQLSESAPRPIVADIEKFVGDARRIARAIGTGVCPRDKLPRPLDIGVDELEETLVSMIATGLLEESGAGLELTEDGRALMKPKEAKRRAARSDRDRERVGDATK